MKIEKGQIWEHKDNSIVKIVILHVYDKNRVRYQFLNGSRYSSKFDFVYIKKNYVYSKKYNTKLWKVINSNQDSNNEK